MRKHRGMTLLECLVFMGMIGGMAVVVGPIVMNTYLIRERIFQRVARIMHQHVMLASIAADIRQGPLLADQWEWADDAIAWRGNQSHAWRCRQKRLWFYEGGVPTPVGDDIDILSGHPIIRDGIVRGVWLALGDDVRVVTWYAPVYEGLL